MNSQQGFPGGTHGSPAGTPAWWVRSARWTWEVLGSFGLTCVILILLTVLTFAGTLAQTEHSLFDVQNRYFSSLFVLVPLGPLALPLPGAYALLVLLAANLIVGGLIGIRKSRRTAGVLVVHVGMLILLLGGVIEHTYSDRGTLKLYEGNSGSAYQSVEIWELVIQEQVGGAAARTWILPQTEFDGLRPGRSQRYELEGLGLDVLLADYVRNCDVIPDAAAGPHGHDAASTARFRFKRMDPDAEEAGRDIPGLRVRLALPGEASEQAETLLWGAQVFPWAAEIGGRSLRLSLRRQQFALPFGVRLEQFIKEDHPGTRMARRFSSFVIKVEGSVETRIHITMNEPLRHEGYTLYQSGWGPQSDKEPPMPYSIFSVVRNPADQMPLWACIVIGAGLIFHFLSKLRRYVRSESGRRSS